MHALCPPQQIILLASGCELCRIIREPDVGEPVIRTGGGMCLYCILGETGERCNVLRTLSLDTDLAIYKEDLRKYKLEFWGKF